MEPKLIHWRVRISEYKRALLHRDRRNAITIHAMENINHTILWKDSYIKEFEENWFRRRVKEAIWIKMTDKTMNTDSGIQLNVT